MDEAAQRLQAQFQREQDLDALEQLAAVRFVQQPTWKRLTDLLSSMAAQSRDRELLELGLLLADADRLPSSLRQPLLGSALAMDWMRSFGELSAPLPASERLRREGHRAAWWGDWGTALAAYELAEAQPELCTLREALQVRADLGADDPSSRRQALIRWSALQRAGGGASRWRGARWLATASAGGALFLDAEQDRYGERLLATPDEPLQFRIIGPARVRVQLRLLHQPTEERLDDWLLIGGADTVRRLPLATSRPVEGLRLIGQGDERLGLRQTEVLELPPGDHRLWLSALSAPLIADLELEQPLVPWLGPLSPSAIGLVEEGRWAAADWTPANPADRGDQGRMPRVYPTGSAHAQPSPTSPMPDASARARSALSEQGPVEPVPADSIAADHRPPARVQSGRVPDLGSRALTLIAEDGERRFRQSRPLSALQQRLPPPPARLSTDALCPLRLDGLSSERRALADWLWRWEQHGELTPETLTRASQLAATPSADHRLSALSARLLEPTGWEPITDLEQGAGLTRIDDGRWRPDSPGLRARLALLPAVEPDERFLYGYDALLLDLSNPVARRAELALQLQGPPFLPLEPLQVEIELDGAPLLSVPLSAKAAQAQRRLSLPAGEYQLAFRLADPVVNQMVRLRLSLLSDDGEEPLAEPSVKTYQVATAEQPLLVYVDGPAWVRIDEWRDGQVLSEYQPVPAGAQVLELAPAPGQDQRLVRVFQRVLRAEPPIPSRARPMPVAGEPLPTVPGLTPEDLPSGAPLELADWPARPGQEDGTWTWGLAAVETTGLDQNGVPQGNLDDYLQLGLTYREHRPEQRSWWRFDLLNRWRAAGRPTLGGIAEVYAQPEQWPFNWQLRATFFAQWLERNPDWSAGLEGSLSQAWPLGPKALYSQRATLFARHLSRDSAPSVEDFDTDVYSDYKRDHPYGLRLSNRYQRRPWRDSLWWLGAGLASNKDLYSIDWTSLRSGWAQRLGDLELEGQLRWLHQFSDQDRNQGNDEYRFSLGLSWTPLRTASGQLSLVLGLERDLQDPEDHFYMLSLQWQGSQGRGYRDFKPGELRFADLDAWRLIEARDDD